MTMPLSPSTINSAIGPWIATQLWMGANLNGLFGRQGVLVEPWDVEKGDPLYDLGETATALEGMGGWLEFGVPLGHPDVKLVLSGGADVGDPRGRRGLAPVQVSAAADVEA